MTDETMEQIKRDADAYVKRQGSHSQPDITHHDFTKGAESQHPIAYSQGLAEGRRQAIEEALKELAHYKDLFEYKEDYLELKKELEKLKQ